MVKLTAEEIQMVFSRMRLGTDEERGRFASLRGPTPESPSSSKQVFIRVDDATIADEEKADAELA